MRISTSDNNSCPSRSSVSPFAHVRPSEANREWIGGFSKSSIKIEYSETRALSYGPAGHEPIVSDQRSWANPAPPVLGTFPGHGVIRH